MKRVIADRYHDLYPSFRVYDMDRETYEITDFHQYRMYLPEVNRKRRAEWNLTYSFRDFYGFNKMDELAGEKLAQAYKARSRC